MNFDIKKIILVSYRSKSGNLVPAFYFENQDKFNIWFSKYHLLDSAFCISKFHVVNFDTLDKEIQDDITEFIKNPQL